MKKSFKKLLCGMLSLAMIAGSIVLPITASADETYLDIAEADKIVAGDKVIEQWKLSFGSGSAPSDYTRVPKTAHAVMGDIADEPDSAVEALGLGFVGTHADDFNFSERHDGLLMVAGHPTNLKETANGIGSTGSESGTNGFQYPVRFALNTTDGSYFRVKMVVTNLDDGTDATDVTVWSERKHYIISHETITAGEEKTLEFSVDVEPNYFEKSSPTGTIADGQLNVVVAGENVALKSMIIQQVEPGTTLWILGDSTVTDGNSTLPYFELHNYTGVGSGVSKYIRKDIAVSNQGEGGLASGDNYHFNIAKDRIKAGDYMWVEYGHNHKEANGVQNYSGNLAKYYDACKNAKGGAATLVLVGPIDRCNTYDSATNTWGTSLSGFSEAAKAFVDAKIKASANDKVGFVDLNAPSLEWFASKTKQGTVNGQEYKNDARLVYYYFRTARGKSDPDHTHPNDAGAEGMAELFFHNAAAKITAYPALTSLLQTYENTTPADTDTPSGRHASPVAQSVLDNGWTGNTATWPQVVSSYLNATRIRKLNFDGDGKLQTADIGVQDANLMSSYGRCLVATYNKTTGALEGIAISNADENSIGLGYSGWVDNSTGSGVQTVAFDGSDLSYDSSTQTLKAFLWSMEDNESAGYPLTLMPYADDNTGDDGEFVPLAFDYLLTNDSLNGPEQFHFYGKKADTTIADGLNGWAISGVTATSKMETVSDTNVWYGKITGSGTMTHELTSAQKEGIVEVSGKIRKTTGTLAVALADTDTVVNGNTTTYVTGTKTTGLTIEGTAVTDANSASLGATTTDWTEFKYTFDLDRGVIYSSLGETNGTEKEITAFDTMNVDELDPYPLTKVVLTYTGADIELTDFTVKSITRTEDLPRKTVTGAYATDSSSENGKLTTPTSSVTQGSLVTLKALENPENKFLGWYSDEAGTMLYTDARDVTLRASADKTLYAKFKSTPGIFYEDNFDGYTVGEKIHSTGDSEGNGSAPDPVVLGAMTLYAGYRNNGTAAENAGVWVVANTDPSDHYVKFGTGNTSTSGRGVKFQFTSPIDITTGTKVLEFDTKMTKVASAMTLISVQPKSGSSTETETKTIIALNPTTITGLDTEEWVNVKLIFDAAEGQKTLIITDANGKVLNITKSAYSEQFLTGATFYDGSTSDILVNNMAVYNAGTAGKTGVVPFDVTFTAPANTTIKVANEITAVTDSEGHATMKLVEGKYDLTANNANYKTLTQTVTVDSTHAVNLTMQEGAAATITLNYVDADDSDHVIKTEKITSMVSGAGLFAPDAYTLEDKYKANITEATSSGADTFYVYKFVAEGSDTSINALQAGDNNTMTLKFRKVSTNKYYFYEDFDSFETIAKAISDGWTSFDESLLALVEDSGNKYFRYGSTSATTNDRGGSKAIGTTTTGATTVEFDVMFHNSNQNAEEVAITGAAPSYSYSGNTGINNYLVDFTFDKDKKFYINGVERSDAGIEADKWTNIKTAIDFSGSMTITVTPAGGAAKTYTVDRANTTQTGVSHIYYKYGKSKGFGALDNVSVYVTE